MVTSARKRLPFANQQTRDQEVNISNTRCSASAIHVLQGNQVTTKIPQPVKAFSLEKAGLNNPKVIKML